MIVQSKVRDAVKAAEMRTSEEFLGALDTRVAEMVKAAADRAKKNGRATLQAHDL